MAKSVGRAAKSSSRRCLTLVRVTTPTAPRTPLPTKFAVAEKHMGVAPLGGLHLSSQNAKQFLGRGVGQRSQCESASGDIVKDPRERPRANFAPVLKLRPVSASPHFRADEFPSQLSFL